MGRRVDGSLGTLLQGVSQQPARQRLEGQVTSQVNMTSDVVRMLSRRAPTQFLQSFDIGAIDTEKTFVHFMDASDGEAYYVLVPPNVSAVTDIIVLDADTGVRNTNLTHTAQFLSYVSMANPRADLKMVTVGDHTFVVDTNKTVRMKSTLSDPYVNGAEHLRDSIRVTVEVGQYSRDYKVSITINNAIYSETHTTPASTATDAEKNVSTDTIAAALWTLLKNNTTIAANFELWVRGDSIMLWPKVNGLDYNANIADGSGGGAMSVTVMNVVSRLSDLPVTSAANSVYKIKGGTGVSDDLYMRFEVDIDTPLTGSAQYFQKGTWVETLKPDSKYILNEDTMPHIIRRTGVGTAYEMGEAGALNIPSWANKIVGDSETDKEPSFVGYSITNLTTFQDRLVVLADEFVHMSVTTDFFNMWKKTVATLLDDGPIGLSAVSDKVNLLRFANQHNKDMVVFADERQFTIPGKTAITPKTATMTETTSFKIQSNVAPAPSGQNLFFAVDSGAFSGVREFYTDSNLDSDNARPITISVERYIAGKVRDMQSSTNLDKLVVLADSVNTLYVYEYLWDQDEKLQEAWSTWHFDDSVEIIKMRFNADNLDLLVYIGTQLHFLTMQINTDPNVVIGGEVHLDRREEVNATFTATTPNLPTDLSLIDAIQGEGCPNPGLRAEILSYDGTTITFKRDMLGGAVHVGVKYRSSVEPTMPLMRDAGNRVIGTSDLTVGEMFINFEDSGDFNVDVIGDHNYTARNPGRVLGTESATVGEYSLTRGQFPAPVRTATERSSIEIYSDSPYPFTVVDVEWEGQFYKRGQRVTRPG